MCEIKCTNCGDSYPEIGVPFRCEKCGGVYDYFTWPRFEYEVLDLASSGSERSSIWRYKSVFGLAQDAPVISLGEGDTPLVKGYVQNQEVYFKAEYLNPTGSFKDRGSALMTSFLKSRVVDAAIEDSSGNAGASFAAYAARAGIQARIYVPEYASGPKREQIETYGADVISVTGPRSNAADAVKRAADEGEVYASHAYLPHGIPGFATIAYEVFEQIGAVIGTIVTPVGQGGLLLGLGRGFKALHDAGMIPQIPAIVGVQARACAPLWATFEYGSPGLAWVVEGDTLAEGVRIMYPVRGDAVLKLMDEFNGQFVVVDEEEILPGRDNLARQGFYVEPTSAIVWSAITQIMDKAAQPIVAILTGSGLKYSRV